MLEQFLQVPETPTELAACVKKATPVLLLAVFWIWETWRPFFGQSHGRWTHAARNVAIALFNTVVLGLTFGIASVHVTNWAEREQFGLLHQTGLPAFMTFAASLLLLDGWMYLWHRANHTIPFLWRFHRMHHSDRHVDVTTATRFHLGEHFGGAVLRLGVIALLGIELWPLLVYDTLVIAVTQFHHADISLGRCDRWLRWIIVTPYMHKVHHSDWRPETDSNYATVFSFWDRLAGTFRMRANPKSIDFGLKEFAAPSWQSWWGMWRTPFVDPALAEPQPRAVISKIASTSTAAPVGSAANPRALRA